MLNYYTRYKQRQASKPLPLIPAKAHLCFLNYSLCRAIVENHIHGSTNTPWGWHNFDEVYQAFSEHISQYNDLDTWSPWMLVEDWLEGINTCEDDDSKKFHMKLNLPKKYNEAREGTNVTPSENIKFFVEKNNDRNIELVIQSALSGLSDKLIETTDRYDYFKSASIKNIQDLGRASNKVGLAIPELQTYNLLKAMRGELDKVTPFEKERKALFVLWDDSGSMANEAKIKLQAKILAKLQAIHETGIDVIVYPFESDIYADPIDIMNFRMGLDQGGTNVQRSIESMQKVIKDKYNYDKQVVLVVNDGEDLVNKFKTEVQINAISLFNENDGLRECCESTGGLYRNLTR